MTKSDALNIIPSQQEGNFSDIVENITAPDQEQARHLFRKAKEKLLNINHWEKISQGLSASFELTDSKGLPKEGAPLAGDYFKIDVPGPGSSAGNGFDWVQVEVVDDCSDTVGNSEHIAMRVRPAAQPGNEGETAHFFKAEATSSFIVSRIDRELFAEIHGRNEKPNTSNRAAGDLLRNTLVWTGAIAGLSHMQWKNLAKGLLSE